jgi:SAM-dependent methyltransferase
MPAIRKVADFLAINIRKFSKLFVVRFDRELIADMFITGHGIEIGALHSPLRVPKSAKVKYVDRMSNNDLTKQYPELNSTDLVPIDIIDDGEKLLKIPTSTQNFVIANHFLEHCQNPIGAIRNTLRVLKKGGVVYLSIPDKRYSFDADRPATPIGHLLKDFQEGPEWSKKQHFEEWTRYIDKIKDDAEVEERISHLMKLDYSIHYHTWTQAEMLEFMLTLKQKLHFNFELELMLKNIGEVIFILRKTTGEST